MRQCKVILEGRLGDSFGREHSFCAPNLHELMRCLRSKIPGIDDALLKEKYISVDLDNKEEVSLFELSTTNLLDKTIAFYPNMERSKGGGKIFAAILFIAAAAATGGAATAAAGNAAVLGAAPGALGAGFGAASFKAAALGFASSVAQSFGAFLLFGGIAEFLTPTPPDPEEIPNDPTFLTNPTNVNQREGTPIPVVYGRMLTETFLIDASTNVIDREGALINLNFQSNVVGSSSLNITSDDETNLFSLTFTTSQTIDLPIRQSTLLSDSPASIESGID